MRVYLHSVITIQGVIKSLTPGTLQIFFSPTHTSTNVKRKVNIFPNSLCTGVGGHDMYGKSNDRKGCTF